MLTLILAALALPPIPAAKIAARALDVPEQALVAITIRESRGQRIGVHEIDAWASRRACRKARRVRWLAEDVDCTTGDWATVGPQGLFTAYHLRFVGLARWPWVFRIPLVSAVAAARRWDAICRTRPDSWCPEIGGDA